MGMNIKNEEARHLATQVASIYDESLTEAGLSAETAGIRRRLLRFESFDMS